MLIAILILSVLSFLNTFLILMILSSMHEKVNAVARIALICSKIARGFAEGFKPRGNEAK